MRVILFELKKIFSPLRTLFILLCIVLFAVLSAISNFTWGYNANSLETLYGNELDETERKTAPQKIIAMYGKTISEALKNDEWFSKNGVLDYDGIQRLYEKKEIERMKSHGMSSEEITTNGHKDYNPLLDYTLTEYEDEALERFEALRNQNRQLSAAYYGIENSRSLFSVYDSFHDDPDADSSEFWQLTHGKNAAVTKRCREIFTGDEIDSLLPWMIVHQTNAAANGCATLMALSLFALLAPVLTTDNATGARLLQYTSRKGRPLIKSQYAAYLAAAFLIVTMEIILYAAFFLSSDAGGYTDCLLNSFMVTDQYAAFWYSGTFGGYLLCQMGIVYILTPVVASVVFIASHYNSKIISMLLKAIPAAAALTVLSRSCLNYTFAMEDFFRENLSLSASIPIRYIEFYVLVPLFILSVAAAAVALKKNKSKELL